MGKLAARTSWSPTTSGPRPPSAAICRNRFTQLDDARPATSGIGLGLAIARDIAERHHGTLVLDTRQHHPGARFVLTLPSDLHHR
ncbi:ATP-binding protein [Cellulomonas sp. Leaf395]|uniref:ATP-binding protein n=1 Tax=Cellulomonas sp. Leaf395 TaxID=1736362 RepID=UPI0006F709E4|nr:ATP-binding protein [Cellulomonas sp. Leaf395]KQS97347.1 hypothetical protein ASG23_17560 [Cellulomonas sp. Leaf395]